MKPEAPPKKKQTRNTWARLAAFLLLRRMKSVPDSPLDFMRLIHEPKDWLLVMPAEANAFDAVLPFCLELLENLKGVRLHLLVPYDFRHWITINSPKIKVHPFHKQDLIWGHFPRRALIERLHNLKPEVVMDLSPQPTPLSLYASALSGARIRGAISRKYGDEIYNFLVHSRAEEIGERYRALFAYLA
jgi:hypothetical protein